VKEERFFFSQDVALDGVLPIEESIHVTRVLRLKEGDEIFLIDGKGNFYCAELTLVSQKKCLYNIIEKLPQKRQWAGKIRLSIAPTKNIDRIEWMAEKITELGFDELTFLNCKFSERHNIRLDRIEKIIISAMKQSRKAWMPAINDMMSFNDFILRPVSGQKFIAHCYEDFNRCDFFESISKISLNDDISIMIGPEGDFSIEEVKFALNHGFISTSLGNSRLRTETAGLVAVEMMQLKKRI
jgi:16S rRNA (uracil1498-N3)-methyltransferase